MKVFGIRVVTMHIKLLTCNYVYSIKLLTLSQNRRLKANNFYCNVPFENTEKISKLGNSSTSQSYLCVMYIFNVFII